MEKPDSDVEEVAVSPDRKKMKKHSNGGHIVSFVDSRIEKYLCKKFREIIVSFIYSPSKG